MIVSLNDLKRILGLDPNESTEDQNLTRLVNAKTEWVEGYTQRRFDVPIPHVQYTDGNGDDVIYLEWHVEADATIHVFRRPRIERNRPWEELTENTDWERRDQKLLFLRVWQVWDECDEYKIEYDGGYEEDTAPADIVELILQLAAKQYRLDAEITTNTDNMLLSSESIGDYSYSKIESRRLLPDAIAGAVGIDGMRVLDRYKRRFV